MIHIYGRNAPFNAQAISDAFKDGIRDAYNDPNNNYVVGYPDQSDRIALNLSASDEFTNAIHPGGRSSDGVDPTLYAVFIGSFGCKDKIIYYILQSCECTCACICCECTCTCVCCQCTCTCICCKCTCISIM